MPLRFKTARYAIPGLSMYRARVTTLRRALDPANVPTRRWPITVELTQIWTAS
jgi:hypothetical protein